MRLTNCSNVQQNKEQYAAGKTSTQAPITLSWRKQESEKNCEARLCHNSTAPLPAPQWKPPKTDEEKTQTAPIPSCRTVAQVEENCRALQFSPLTAGQMAEIEEILGW